MKLHHDRLLLEQAVRAASKNFNIPEIYIEKDYWVTVALYSIFHSELSSSSVFKGGTALSKCHKLIDRFSEDIDIAVLGKKGESGNQLAKKMKTYNKIVGRIMKEVDHEITHRSGKLYKTVHSYDVLGFGGDYGQVRKEIILEATWLGNSEPFTVEYISCYITDMLAKRKQEDIIEKFELQAFKAQVLSIERTFCEKIMSLVRFSRTETTKIDLKKKVRHIYDLHKLLQSPKINLFFEGLDFDTMLNMVAKEDKESFKNNPDWTTERPSTARIFREIEETWKEISPTYHNIFAKLMIGQLPNEEKIKESLKLIQQRLLMIDWKLE